MASTYSAVGYGGAGPAGLTPVGAANTVAVSDGIGIAYVNALTLAGGYVRYDATHYIADCNGASVFVGGDRSYANQHASVNVHASVSVNLGVGATNYLEITDSTCFFKRPVAGSASAGTPLCFARLAKTWPSDANYPLSAGEASYGILDFSGATLTATRDVVLPITAGGVYFVVNRTGGGQSLRAIGASGTGVTIANARGAWVYCDGTNWIRMTADSVLT